MSADPDSEPSSREPSARGLAPGGRVTGTFRPAGSKSLAQRALVAASLASGTTRIAGLPDAADVHAALALVAAAGARVERVAQDPAARGERVAQNPGARGERGAEELGARGAVRVTGRPPGPHRGWRADGPLALGESGTLGRLALAAAGLCGEAGRALELAPAGSLARRKSPALVAALRAAGVGLEPTGAGVDGFAWRVRPIGPPSDLVIERPGSSQEVSALALALAAYPDATRLTVRGAVPSRPYLDMTLAVLARFGARIEVTPEVTADGDDLCLGVRGPLAAPAEPVLVEPDASSAAVALAAACLTGGELRVPGLGPASLQGDVRVTEHLAAFGCEAAASADGLVARGRPRRGAELDLEREPDLAPVMAAVGGAVALAARRGELAGPAETRLTGLGTLPGKESSRIEVLAAGLARLGLAVRASATELVVAPGAGPLPAEPVVLDPAGDHRMAFAFALVGLVRAGVRVADEGCVAKSWPGFWTDLARLGARTCDE